MVSIFYNKQDLKDTMVICFSDKLSNKIEQKKDVTILKHEKEIIGINIFNVSKYIKIKEGYLYPTNELIDFIFKIAGIKITNESKNFQICEIIKCTEIKGTHLKECIVKIDDNNLLNIVCGASNAKEGLKTVVAKIGTFMPNGLYIKKGVLQGKESYGMLCSYKELYLKEKKDTIGIIELPRVSCNGDEYKNHYSNI